MLYEVAQKGAGYGVYLIATAPGTAFPYKLSGFFKTKLTLRRMNGAIITELWGAAS